MEIRLKGWQAVVVLLAIVAFVAFRYTTARATLDTEGAEVMRQWVAAEYQRYHLDRTDLTDEERARLLLATDSVRFRTISGRGSPDDMVVRVEIEPSAALLPDGVLDRDGLAPPGGRDGAFLPSRFLLRSRWGRMDG